MLHKLAGAALVCSALVAGSAGVASAATPGSTAPGAARGINCARAPQVLDRLQGVDARITTALPKLQAAEKKAVANHHPKAAARIERRVDRLTKLGEKVADRIARVEQHCPGVTPSAGSAPSGTSA